MKYIIIIFFWFFLNQITVCQDNTKVEVPLKVIIPADYNETLDEQTQSKLLKKLMKMASNYGISGEGFDGRFIVFPQVDVERSDIRSGMPKTYILTLSVSLYIADYPQKTLFSSTNFTVTGSGVSSKEAFNDAFTSIPTENSTLEKFFQKGKEKIVNYFNENCVLIQNEANTLASMKLYVEAMSKLASIPPVCSSCYYSSFKLLKPIYQDYIDHKCRELLLEARTKWASQPNSEGAKEVSNLIIKIDPDSKCFKDALDFVNEIRDKILKNENREWDFKLKVYDDKLELEKYQIEAIKAISISNANNQPKVEYHIREIIR
jgi:hypothetical protein